MHPARKVLNEDGMSHVEAQKKFLHENPPLVTLKMKMLHLEEKPSDAALKVVVAVGKAISLRTGAVAAI
ncbi:hypothetical protein E4U09_000106 [Claviceps aff. purpurea]|uniref:Uncharacterized protein n=1 Tax=Claviceps aff. purpurea TaxID=1967640 RepID=A0A9P7QNS6_9HYPO|nr:hypothetical protein E4U09_000106 [Claviceps aff. purpurea]